jgi:RNA polymerase sigma-70 factor (ECF subfamily)
VASTQPIDTAVLDAEPQSELVESSDAVLARALMAREKGASKIAWARYSPMVRRIMRRSLGPERDVEDAVQDVFLCVFDKVPTLRNPAALRAFIISVAVRTLRYEIRRRRVRSWLRLTGDTETPDLRVVHPDTDSREALVRFYGILDRINARDRTAFVLHYIEGMEVPDVAAALGVSVPTTRRCLARARERLVLFAGRDPLLIQYVAHLEGD